MNNTIEITVRSFPVTSVDERTGQTVTDSIVLTKTQLEAARIVGESCKELIYRVYNRRGYTVKDIGKPVKKTIALDLYRHGDEIVAEGDARVDTEEAV